MVFNLFFKGLPKAISVEHNMRSGFVSLDLAGKPIKSWQVKNFVDAFYLPYNFTAEGYKFTLRRGVDSEGDLTDSLELEIEGMYFKLHPYLNIDFGKYLH